MSQPHCHITDSTPSQSRKSCNLSGWKTGQQIPSKCLSHTADHVQGAQVAENNLTECTERAEIRTVELESSKQSLYSYFLTYSRLKKTKNHWQLRIFHRWNLTMSASMVLVPRHWENRQETIKLFKDKTKLILKCLIHFQRLIVQHWNLGKCWSLQLLSLMYWIYNPSTPGKEWRLTTTIHWKHTCLFKIQIFSVRKIRRQSEKTAQCVAQHRLSDQTHLISGLVGPEAR